MSRIRLAAPGPAFSWTIIHLAGRIDAPSEEAGHTHSGDP